MTQGAYMVPRSTHPHVTLVVGLAVTLAGGWWKTDADKSRQIADLQARTTELPARRDRELDQLLDRIARLEQDARRCP